MLSNVLGENIVFQDKLYSLFPCTEAIANSTLETLLDTKIGYRAPYLKQSAQKLISESIPIHDDEDEIRKWLSSFPGRGPKVADCILIYSLGFKDVIPLDTWMQKIFFEKYNLPTKYKYDDIRKWYRDKWGNNSGIIGQYLFEAYRK